MSLPYIVDDNKKEICVIDGYISYLSEIHKEITDNQIKILDYKSCEDIGTNFDFHDNPIEEITYTTIYGITPNNKFKKQNLSNLPEKLLILKLDGVYVECYKMNNLPKGLKKLHMPLFYNWKLDNLPDELEELSVYVFIDNNNFTNYFDFLPESLKELKISSLTREWSGCIDNLPNGLEKIFLGTNVDCELNNLPRNLKVLHLGKKYMRMIYNLPDGLEELKIINNYKYLREIFLSAPIVKLKKIIIKHECCNTLYTVSSFDLQSIPSSVEEIVFDNNFNQPLDYLPPGIKKITFGTNFNHSIGPKNMPDSVEYLKLGYNYNIRISKYPANLKVLKFGRNYTSNIKNLPLGLIELEINEKFDNLILDLPATLEILKFDKNSEYSQLNKLELPNSIKILQLGKPRSQSSCIKNIPNSLEYIKYYEPNKKIKKMIDKSGWKGKIEYW